MQRQTATGYYLCLVPAQRTSVRYLLDGIIEKIAHEYGSPVFVPHVTLVGSGEDKQIAIEKTRILASQLLPYEIKLGSVGSNGIHFQILFYQVEQTGSVMQANAIAQKVFGGKPRKYFPHLSLAYGDFSPSEVSILKKLVERSYQADTMNFSAQGIELWHCQGTAEEWKAVEFFPFGKK